MNQVNLLPPEILQRERTRRLTGLVALVGALVVLLILALWVVETLDLSNTSDQLAAQEATNATLQSQVQGLQRYAETQSELATKQALVAKVYKNEISWSGVLGDLSNVVPDNAYLQSLTFQGRSVEFRERRDNRLDDDPRFDRVDLVHRASAGGHHGLGDARAHGAGRGLGRAGRDGDQSDGCEVARLQLHDDDRAQFRRPHAARRRRGERDVNGRFADYHRHVLGQSYLYNCYVLQPFLFTCIFFTFITMFT